MKIWFVIGCYPLYYPFPSQNIGVVSVPSIRSSQKIDWLNSKAYKAYFFPVWNFMAIIQHFNQVQLNSYYLVSIGKERKVKEREMGVKTEIIHQPDELMQHNFWIIKYHLSWLMQLIILPLCGPLQKGVIKCLYKYSNQKCT